MRSRAFAETLENINPDRGLAAAFSTCRVPDGYPDAELDSMVGHGGPKCWTYGCRFLAVWFC